MCDRERERKFNDILYTNERMYIWQQHTNLKFISSGHVRMSSINCDRLRTSREKLKFLYLILKVLFLQLK